VKEITSAILSSILKDLSSRRGKVVLIGLAIAVLIVIVDLFWLRGKPSSSVIEQAALSPLSLTEENGDKWTLELVRGQPISRISTSSKKPGPPLLVRTNVRKINNNQLSIGITVEGQAGEKYIGGALKNGKREPEPQFIIVNEKERILARGKFEYG
jgi:hypothetical protein